MTSDELPYGTVEAITGDENVMILAPAPGDESLWCGGLIARSCRRGRPPFVMVLGDGSASPAPSGVNAPDRLAALHERETRAAVARLGLPAERLLMVGLFDGTIPEDGPVFEAVVRAVTLVMWARDCNVVCAPWRDSPAADHRAAYRIAAEVSTCSGVGFLAYAAPSTTLRPDGSAGAWRLDVAAQLQAKRDAIAAHVSRSDTDDAEPHLSEVYLRPAASAPERV
jgi:LmbE family N-acetylglucosaminyl deacetylase